jgi:uncharacterized membrane protein
MTSPEQDDSEDELPGLTKENLDVIAGFHDRETRSTSGIQLAIERISAFFGSPWYFASCVVFILLWMVLNSWGVHAHWHWVDAPPFALLQGLVSANALLITIAVLIRQNRMARLAAHRSHLDLQINLLTEQKTTKILQLVDELHRELTELRRRPDTQLEEMRKPADAGALLDAIKQQSGDG